MKKYLIAIESDKTKEEIAEKLGVDVESIMTHEELQKKYILNPNHVIIQMKKEAYHSNGLEHIRTWCAVVGLIISAVGLSLTGIVLSVVLK